MRDVSLEVLFLIKAETCGVSKKYLKSNEQLEHKDQYWYLSEYFSGQLFLLGWLTAVLREHFLCPKWDISSKLTERKKSSGNCRGERPTRTVSPNYSDVKDLAQQKLVARVPTLDKIQKVGSLTRSVPKLLAQRTPLLNIISDFFNCEDQVLCESLTFLIYFMVCGKVWRLQ